MAVGTQKICQTQTRGCTLPTALMISGRPGLPERGLVLGGMAGGQLSTQVGCEWVVLDEIGGAHADDVLL